MEEALQKKLIEAGVDFERTMERFLNNDAFYQKFLIRFPNDPNFGVLEKAVQEKNLENLERAAHTLKGVSANLGLDPIAKILNEMVQAIRSGQPEKLDEQYAQMKQQYEVFREIIEQLPAQ